MDEGLLNSNIPGVGWSKRRRFAKLIPRFVEEEILFVLKKEAFRCKKCKLVLFYYNKKRA